MHYIYCITNKINNKSYVGQAVDIQKRWHEHIHSGEKKTFAFQNALKKYGSDNFIWQIIEEHETLEESNEAEEFFIAYLGTLYPNGYNLLPGGNNRKLLPETKKKISETLKRTGHGSFTGKKGPLHPNFGKHLTQEHKNKVSKALSGDGGPGKKINSDIARNIYIEYLENNLSVSDIINKYPLKKGAIINILKKKTWREATANFIDTDLKTKGIPKIKITNEEAISLKNEFKHYNGSNRSFCLMKSVKFNVSWKCIYNILTGNRRII